MPVRTINGNRGPSSLRSAEAQQRAVTEYQRKIKLIKAELAFAAAEIAEKAIIAERAEVVQSDTTAKPTKASQPFKPSRVVDLTQERENLRVELMAAISNLPDEKQAEILKRFNKNGLTDFQLSNLLKAR